MASEPEVIHQEIEETRADLAKKLETLESEITDTVKSARETVEETIENVTETVQETVETVKKTFDLEYQMRQRPWTLMAGATVAGFLVGAFVLRPRRSYRPEHAGWFGGGGFYPHDESSAGGIDTRSSWTGSSSWTEPSLSTWAQPQQTEAPRREEFRREEPRREEFRHEEPRHEHRPGLVEGLMNTFGDELNMVKQMAIGYGVGLVRDMLKDALPTLGEKVEQVMDSATHKMGGEPVHGRVMGEQHHDQGQQQQSGFQAR
jgi:ElaB/YqjD/DUF883 family membrane-anchored ribosome-binding protein